MNLLLTSRKRTKLLAYLFAHADESYYVRELSTLTGIDPGNLSRELRGLEEQGILLSRHKGRVKLYSPNRGHALYADLKNILFKTEGIQAALSQLVLSQKGIETALIYGSYAKGNENKESDVDLLVIGKFDRDSFTGRLRALESKLNKEINFTSYERDEFNKERKKDGSFLQLVMKEKIILLKGSVDGD